MAIYITSLQAEKAQSEEIFSFLDELKSLSDEEAQQLLAQQMQ